MKMIQGIAKMMPNERRVKFSWILKSPPDTFSSPTCNKWKWNKPKWKHKFCDIQPNIQQNTIPKLKGAILNAAEMTCRKVNKPGCATVRNQVTALFSPVQHWFFYYSVSRQRWTIFPLRQWTLVHKIFSVSWHTAEETTLCSSPKIPERRDRSDYGPGTTEAQFRPKEPQNKLEIGRSAKVNKRKNKQRVTATDYRLTECAVQYRNRASFRRVLVWNPELKLSMSQN